MSEISNCSSNGECGSRLCYCNKMDESGCHYFMWLDDGLTGRAKDVFCELKQKKEIAEEKVKILEEKLEIADEKLKIAHQRVINLEEKLKMLEDNDEKKRLKMFKNLLVVIVVGMLLFYWDNKMVKGRGNLYLL
ncbi:hypothetical protein ACET3Z_018153 [Daucus carota]